MARESRDLTDDEVDSAPQDPARPERSGASNSWGTALERLEDALVRLSDAAEQAERTRATGESPPPPPPARPTEPIRSLGGEDESVVERSQDMVAALAAGALAVPPPVGEVTDFWSQVGDRFRTGDNAPLDQEVEATSAHDPSDSGHAPRPASGSDADVDADVDADTAEHGLDLDRDGDTVDDASERPSRLAYAMAIGAVALAVIGMLYLVLSEPGKSAVAWPDEYLDVVSSVQETRGHRFASAIPVESVSTSELASLVAQDPMRRQLNRSPLGAQGVEFLRSLGLWEGELDALPTEVPGSVHEWAFYDIDENKLYVREGPTDAALLISVAHQLAIALDDQRNAISARSEDQASSANGLVEGEARLAMVDYIGRLGDDGKDAGALLATPESPTTPEVPTAVVIERHAPSDLGAAMVAALRAAPAGDERDRAFANPPTRSENLVEPLTALAGAESVPVEAPPVPEDARAIRRGEIGALGWLAVLGERLDPKTTLTAVDGWGGDAYVVHQKAGRVCTTIAWKGDTAIDLIEMSDALATWSASMPAALSAIQGDTLFLATCDPGPGTPALEGGAVNAYSLVSNRSALFLRHVGFYGPKVAWCISKVMIHSAPVDQIVNSDLVKGEAFTFFQPAATELCTADPDIADRLTPPSTGSTATPTTSTDGE